MPAVTATAPGKIILFGEHAVVYEKPAIAAPVRTVRARAVVMADIPAPPGRIRIEAPDIGLESDYQQLPGEHPLRVTISQVLNELGVIQPPAFRLRLSSTIPIASGMGSGAAITIAAIRAVAAFLGTTLPDERVSRLAYEVEKLYHGTPSGIDNTVITYETPVYFQRKAEKFIFEPLRVSAPFHLVIGDTGIRSPTAKAVGDLRSAWQQDPEYYEGLFIQVGEIVETARLCLEKGNLDLIGKLMDDNHVLLQTMGVSSPELDGLTSAARQAGALGAKLSGGGKGGNMIALSTQNQIRAITQALELAGAVRILETVVVS